MPLPSPLPDNPKRWEGWRSYNSTNFYERLCLSFDENPTVEQIEENCRQLLVWWQKKLPLKNQPSNPITQMLRVGLDEAAHFLVEAKTALLDPVKREAIDSELREQFQSRAMGELEKFFEFATAGGVLREEDENQLYKLGVGYGLEKGQIEATVGAALEIRGIQRYSRKAEEEEKAAAVAARAAPVESAVVAGNPSSEFRRVLKMSGLDEYEMTDDQRDALCNIGENLGLTGGQAEDLIDEYLDEMSSMPRSGAEVPRRTSPVVQSVASTVDKRASTPLPVSETGRPKSFAAVPKLDSTPIARSMERQRFPNFTTISGIEMRLVPTGYFLMGSTAPEAVPNEQPVAKVGINCFYMSRYPITNAQYEQFDPAHRSKRAPWADENHPVIYVNSREAEKFCLWLSNQEGRRFRLPTEAEWEYAARGTDGRNFPWGADLIRGDLANFADANTRFPWRVIDIDDGYARTAPVGTYPKGASPFGIEDMAGNVYEWCADYFAVYPSRERLNPLGPTSGVTRVYRGGSWRSRIASLRVSARAFNQPEYSSNDVGFRVICEIDR